MIIKTMTSIDLTCTHCGLPVPAGLVVPQRDVQFCCGGCEGAWQLIHANGLESFYRMANSQSETMTLKEREASQSRFGDFDSATFLDRYSVPAPPGQGKIRMALDGLHCAACIWLVEKLPSILPGVVETRVNWTRGTVQVTWIKDQVLLSEIARTLHQLGYTPHPIRESEKARRFQEENRKHLTRLGVAGALAGNNMIFSAALYFGMFAHMTAGMSQLMRIASCLVGLAALLFPGRVFLQSAVSAIRTRTPHMDLPIALALFVGTVAGTINVIRGAGEIYFDSLSVLIFLLLIGRWLQFRQQARAADAVELLYRMTPKTARKRNADGEATETLVDLLCVGDQLEIRAGELFPADAIIVSGDCHVDESILTGESVAVARSAGDQVYAGTLNTSRTVIAKVVAVAGETRLSRIAQLIEDSDADRPQAVQWANRIGGYFVVVVTLLAAITFIYWSQTSVETAIDLSIALLIVACPCALALATPLAIAVALGRAARSKVMIKSGDVLQTLQRPGMIWLDKTGTLTEGNLRVQTWHGDKQVLAAVALLEAHSQHPVGKALVQFASDEMGPLQNSDSDSVENITEHIGLGMTGEVGTLGITVGKRQLLERQQVVIAQDFAREARQLAAEGQMVCWIAVAEQVVAIAGVIDGIRDEAGDAIRQLRQRGWQPGVLSGDQQEIVDRVATRLGIEPDLARGNVSPEEKLAIVKQTAQSRTTVMVGDGVNDSAALAAADIGLAVKGGAEASLAAAPVYLAKPGLLPILELMQISDSATRTMKRNLAVSLTYNLCFASLAFAGYINPLVAAILMPISSLTVVSLSLRSGRIAAKEAGGVSQ